MANITGIMCLIKTGEVEKARTDGNVYLGIGGREFALNSGKDDDFEWSDSPVFVLGQEFTPSSLLAGLTKRGVVQAPWNDPGLGYQLEMDELDNFPKYVRFEPDDSDDEWNLEWAQAEVRDAGGMIRTFRPPKGFAYLWLSNDSGKVIHLVEQTRKG